MEPFIWLTVAIIFGIVIGKACIDVEKEFNKICKLSGRHKC